MLAAKRTETEILVLCHVPLFRESLAEALTRAGFSVTCASSVGSTPSSARPRLILFDADIPRSALVQSLETLRAQEVGAPVMLMGTSLTKEDVSSFARCGVRDFMLKTALTLEGLLQRIRRKLAKQRESAGRSEPESASGDADHVQAVSPCKPGGSAVTPLLSREDCIARVETSLQCQTLSGVVMQVIALAASPRSDTSSLADLIGHDPLLSARVLQVANSAAYVTGHGLIGSIPEAVRRIGCATVRNLAAAVGIFEAMPQSSPDGFNPIRCWNHSFAVARLCEQLVDCKDPEMKGTAYLVGLCHDLAEILFRTRFAGEYHQILETSANTGMNLANVERDLIGISRMELLGIILGKLGLPAGIRAPIEDAHAVMSSGASPRERLGRVLRLAEYYVNGLQLAAGPASLVSPITQTECHNACGEKNPAGPEAFSFRGEILALTAVLARLPATQSARIMEPLFPSGQLRVLLLREAAFSSFDPVEAALRSLAEVDVVNQLSPPDRPNAYSALVIVSRTHKAPGLTPSDIDKWLAQSAFRLPVLWLSLHGDPISTSLGQSRRYPISLTDINQFLEQTALTDAKHAA